MRTPAIAAVAAVCLTALVGCSTISGAKGGAATSGAAPKSVSVIVPADPGGGWDQTGRSMAKSLTAEKIVGSAPVTNVSGAGGTVGLAKLANEKDPNTLMVTGLVMVGAVETNKAAVTIDSTTPIAKLTEEPLVVVVPAKSKYTTLKQLVDDIIATKQAVSVTGGSAGGADHILAGLLLQSAGLKGGAIASSLNYVPNSGGGEAVNLLIGGKASAGISGVGEFVEYIKSGELRALAVSSETADPQLPDVPTAKAAGYDVVLTNWRGVLAPGGISDAQRAALVKVVTTMHDSPAWEAELKAKGWTDSFVTGSAFDGFLSTNIADVTTTLRNIGLVG